MQQHIPRLLKQEPPFGWPAEATQKWLHSSGAVGHNVESKQSLSFGKGRSPATINKNQSEMQFNIMDKYLI